MSQQIKNNPQIKIDGDTQVYKPESVSYILNNATKQVSSATTGGDTAVIITGTDKSENMSILKIAFFNTDEGFKQYLKLKRAFGKIGGVTIELSYVGDESEPLVFQDMHLSNPVEVTSSIDGELALELKGLPIN